MTDLVLLHLFGSSHREWDGLIPSLSNGRRVIALDLPGFGDLADRKAADVAGMASHVEATIAESRIGPCIIVGHSMSGKVAALVASRDPTWLRGLILVAPSPPSPEPMTDEQRAALLAFDGSREAATGYVDGLTAMRPCDDDREVAIADAMRASPDAWKAWVVDGSQEDLSVVIGRRSLPVLIVVGSKDPSLGEAIQRERVLPHFPDGHLEAIDGGHALPIENPTALLDAIHRFVDRVDRSRPDT